MAIGLRHALKLKTALSCGLSGSAGEDELIYYMYSTT